MNKILIVDDQLGIRMLLKEVLRREGFEVYEAESGEEAMMKFYDKNPKLVFLDLKIPKMNGIEVLKAMKKENENVSVIMMTAYSELNIIEEVYRLGACTCLRKPFDINEIRVAANEWYRKTHTI